MSFEYRDQELEKLRGPSTKDDARRGYMQSPPIIRAAYEPPADIPLRGWLALTVAFKLQAPWFSKDDRPFHLLDNPVRRDRAFGAPFIPASSWKGLLRWAMRMQTGLLEHLEANDNELCGWKDSAEVIHLFGNERDEEANFQRGALAFRPTWFDKVCFEVINPHDRATKAGKLPIFYEVVPPGAEGELRLLYAPAPGAATKDAVNRQKPMLLLLDAVEALLTRYGFSAKRTSGWGVANIEKASLKSQDHGCERKSIELLRRDAAELLGGAS